MRKWHLSRNLQVQAKNKEKNISCSGNNIYEEGKSLDSPKADKASMAYDIIRWECGSR